MSNTGQNQNVPQTNQFMNNMSNMFIGNLSSKNIFNDVPKNLGSVKSDDELSNRSDKETNKISKIPDLVELFNEIDIPFNKMNKNIFLIIFLHSLNQVKGIAKNMKDFRNDLDNVIYKIKEAIKNKDFFEKKIEYADFSNPIDILEKLERKELTLYDIYRIYLGGGEEKDKYIVKVINDLDLDKNITVFDKEHFEFEEEIYKEYSNVLENN